MEEDRVRGLENKCECATPGNVQVRFSPLLNNFPVISKIPVGNWQPSGQCANSGLRGVVLSPNVVTVLCLDPGVWLRCGQMSRKPGETQGGGGVEGKNGAACNAVASRYKNQNKLQRLGSIVDFISLYLELYCFSSTINVSINERKRYVNRMTPSKFNLLVFVHS